MTLEATLLHIPPNLCVMLWQKQKSVMKEALLSFEDNQKHRAARDTSKAGPGGGGGKDEMSVEETNKLRASLGLAPLK